MTGFDLFYIAMSPIAAPLLAYKALRYGKYRESMPGMFGRGLKDDDASRWNDGSVWVHAVSAGEVMAARAMLPHLRARFPSLPVLLTTVTETGQAQARALPEGMADAVHYYPADFSWIVKRFVAHFRPKIYIPMETELWPNALQIVGNSGAKCFVLNGKISEKSFRSYSRVRSVFSKPLGCVTAFCMQTARDAERIGVICGDPSRVFVTGNCKFDAPMPDVAAAREAELRNLCGTAEGSRIVVAGSTHPGEEEIVLDAYKELLGANPDVALVLVPRHPERFDTVWQILEGSGLRARRMVGGQSANHAGPGSVVLVDRMRMLADLYGICDVAVVAGSFVDGIGGHNLLEAAAHGVPVVYGPFMFGQPDMVRILDAEHGGIQVNRDSLGGTMMSLLADPRRMTEMGRLGREAVLANQGAAKRNIEIISRFV
ncbi:MAG: 3-deoxy-D-manno-octulosonic acid transferase [Candidatus Sumerlaeaceae bacterium]|nr:3-deoxy-D-manno-octulosonic acid transferase [Candidatus Sumerlaeaceae bacterium]